MFDLHTVQLKYFCSFMCPLNVFQTYIKNFNTENFSLEDNIRMDGRTDGKPTPYVSLPLPWMAKESPLLWARWSPPLFRHWRGDQRAQSKGLSFAWQSYSPFCGSFLNLYISHKWLIYKFRKEPQKGE